MRSSVTEISPDGGSIAVGEEDGTVWVSGAVSCQPLWGEKLHDGPVLALAWSPDGSRLASGGLDLALHVVDAASGQVLCSFAQSDSPVETLAWSPDGSKVASAGGAAVHHWTLPQRYRAPARCEGRVGAC